MGNNTIKNLRGKGVKIAGKCRTTPETVIMSDIKSVSDENYVAKFVFIVNIHRKTILIFISLVGKRFIDCKIIC